MKAVEAVDGGFEAKFAAGNLKLLDEVGCAGEDHAPAVLDESDADVGYNVQTEPSRKFAESMQACRSP
jgi:hypothetical protein